MTTYTTTATNTNSVDNTVVLLTTANMVIGLPIIFTGTTFGGIDANVAYYIRTIESDTVITLTTVPGGPVFALTTATGTMTATYDSGGQYIIITTPPGETLNSAFNKINLNFDQIFAAGPVLSNIQIANNAISTLDTNGNIQLSPNGIGKIVVDTDILPSTGNLRSIGSDTQRFNTVFAQTLNISGSQFGDNISVSGNISAGGFVSAVGNVSGNYIHKDPQVPRAPEPQAQPAHKDHRAIKAYKVCKVLWVPQVPLD